MAQISNSLSLMKTTGKIKIIKRNSYIVLVLNSDKVSTHTTNQTKWRAEVYLMVQLDIILMTLCQLIVEPTS